MTAVAVKKGEEITAVEIQAVRAELKGIIQKKNATSVQISRETGIEKSALSAFLNDKYTGDNASIAERAQAWIEIHKRPTVVADNSVEQEVQAVRDEINDILDNDKSVNAAQISREASVNSGALSSFRAGSYSGRNDTVAKRLCAWLETRSRRIEASKEIIAGPGFIMTHTAERVSETLQYAHMAQDVVLIYGGAGVGKTETLREYVRSNSGICLATMTPAHSTVSPALREIGKCMGVKWQRDNAELFEKVCIALKEQQGLLIIDEAQHLGIKALDQIRSIHDRVNCGLALVGNEQVYSRMAGTSRADFLDRLYSRIGMRVHLGRATKADADRLSKAWGVTASDILKLLYEIAQKPGGLRGVSKTIRLAHLLTGEGDIEAKHIRAAWKRLASEVMS